MSLARLLTSIDGAGYGAYKKLHGSYELGEYRLRVDKVQSDPFAPPSLMQVDVPNPVPAELAGVAARDFLTRRIAQAFSDDRDLHIDQPGQQVLDRASVVLADDTGPEASHASASLSVDKDPEATIAHYRDWSNHDVLVLGPEAEVDGMLAAFAAAGLDPATVQTQSWGRTGVDTSSVPGAQSKG